MSSDEINPGPNPEQKSEPSVTQQLKIKMFHQESLATADGGWNAVAKSSSKQTVPIPAIAKSPSPFNNKKELCIKVSSYTKDITMQM